MKSVKKFEDIINEIKKHCVNEKGTGKYGKGIQVLDLLTSTGDLMGFCRGNVIKYVARHGKKTELQDTKDLYKAIHYIMIMIQEIENADNS
tara:strand:- start:336 stop:608 length:273 start_codon:yes stop_codon:yes gene_type:complete